MKIRIIGHPSSTLLILSVIDLIFVLSVNVCTGGLMRQTGGN